MLTLLTLLSAPADAAPSWYSECTTTYAGSDVCFCLKQNTTSLYWWGTVSTRLGWGWGGANAVNGTCYDYGNVIAAGGASATLEKQFYTKGETWANSVTKNVYSGSIGGWYSWDLADSTHPDQVVWETTGGTISAPEPPGHILPGLNPWDWELRDKEGELMTVVHGNPGTGELVDAIFGDWNDDQIMDVTLVWQNDQMWDAYGPFVPWDPITPPQ
ncbi:MAG: hypothetical protein H6737_06690 [Alphaproteobacteria bacterium]|nr:hypothetical protein [Alphaproteobacteria bacterium]